MLSEQTVRAHGAILVAAWASVPRWFDMIRAIEFVAWKHGIQLTAEDGERGEYGVASSLYKRLRYNDLLRLKVDVVYYGRLLKSCYYLNSFFNADP
eukprot:50055-Eustigmatos_ZCMA.PRE.1